MTATWQRSGAGRRTEPGRDDELPALTTPVRVGLVDDHGAVAVAVRAAFERTGRLQLVAAAATVDALLQSCRVPPALVVLDLRLADGSSPTTNVAQLSDAGARVIAYTSGEDSHLLRLAARTPMIGMVRKSEPLHVLTAALLDAVVGRTPTDPVWITAMACDPRMADARLSRNEQHVLSLFADGCTAQAVADLTGTALSTVEDYIRRIRVKYTSVGRPAATKVDLYKRAIEDGFLPPPTHR